jgi:hypothetical protein
VGILPDETFKNGGRGSRRAICDRCQWGQSGKDRSGDEVRHSFVVCNGLFGDCLMIVYSFVGGRDRVLGMSDVIDTC